VGGYYRLNELGFSLSAGAHIIRRSEFKAVEEANQVLAEAEASAAQTVHEAKEAYHAEKQRGYEDGLVEARIESVGQLLHENHELDRGLLGVERDLARLVAGCVRKFIDGFDDKARAEALVKAALKQMRREKVAELRVPTELYGYFRERITAIVSEFPEVQLVDVVEDASLDPSRIILETSIGRVDGNIAQRLDDIEAIIRSAHAKASADALDALASTNDMANGANYE
jgi:type III secretion protein L